MKYSIAFVIFIAWAASMALLASRHPLFVASPPPTPSPSPSAAVPPSSLATDHWMGIYMKGEKTGWAHTVLSPTDTGYRLSENMFMRLKVMDEQKELSTSINALLDPQLVPLSFEGELKTDFTLKLSGIFNGNTLYITINNDGSIQERTITLSNMPSFEAALLQSFAGSGLAVGHSLTMPTFDPASLSITPVTLRVERSDRIMVMGRMRDAFIIKGDIKGLEFTTWVSLEGEVLRQETQLGFTFLREEEKQAKLINTPSLDLIYETAVKFNMKLPRETRYLKTRISGIDLKGLALDGGRQTLTGDIIEIRREDESELRSAAFDPQQMSEWLEATQSIQSDNEAIRSLVREIVGDDGGVQEHNMDTLRKARLINDWVYSHIEKVPVISFPSALEVLSTRRGDCNEHAALYTALARAAAIPTRIAAGLVAKDDIFYYHAWPEVWLGRWVAVDPTFGQFPADATHIRLATGELEGQSDMLRVMGRIALEGMSYQ